MSQYSTLGSFKTHKLKCWPPFFQEIVDKLKRFELRRDDRNFQTGDVLELYEWDPETEEYTGRIAWGTVTYILRGGEFPGLEEGFVIMSLNSVYYREQRAEERRGVPCRDEGEFGGAGESK